MQGKTLEQAAAQAGMSAPSGRKYREGPLPSGRKKPRDYRTRKDPFADVWEAKLVPLLERDTGRELRATELLDWLRIQEPECDWSDGVLRTLQRRMSDWRAIHGSDRDVVFDQRHEPGREAAFDFTDCRELEVTIGGAEFRHLLFTLTLSSSGWRYAGLAFSETFEALVSGIQDALWALGGVPKVLRHDNLSAATRELRRGTGRTLTTRFKEFTEHLDVESTRIRPRHSQENGKAENTNRWVKSWIEQALLLRGHRDFQTADAYVEFVHSVVAQKNSRKAAKISEEQAVLRALPAARFPEHTEFRSVVHRTSTIAVGGRRYSVPSRLIGHEVRVEQFADRVCVYFGATEVMMCDRIRGERGACIDYRHIIHSLSRKPGAFPRYRYREELYPSPVFRRAFDALETQKPTRGHIAYLRILKLAANTMECIVEQALEELLAAGKLFDSTQVELLIGRDPTEIPNIIIAEPDLAAFDELLGHTEAA